jgi:hypothetical protein
MANRQVRRRLSEDEMNRGIGMLEAGRSQNMIYKINKERSTQRRCLQDVEPIQNDWKCLAVPRRRSGTFNDSSPGPIYCPSDKAPTVLERYDLK